MARQGRTIDEGPFSDVNMGMTGNDIRHTGKLGTKVLVPANDSRTVVQVSGGDERLAEDIAICLVPPDPKAWPTGLPGGLFPDLFATIEFGVEGLNTEFDVDYLFGACLSLPANFIRVIAHNNQFGLANGPALSFGAFFVLRTLASRQSPQRSINYGFMNPGGNAIFPIPLFAKSVRVVANSVAAHFQVSVGTFTGPVIDVPAGTLCPDIPLTNFLGDPLVATNGVRVDAIAGAANYAAIYTLSV